MIKKYNFSYTSFFTGNIIRPKNISELKKHLNYKHTIIGNQRPYGDTFTEKALNFLITSPEKCSDIIFKGIKNNKEIIYIDNLWRVIMWIIFFIPEKIFKKLNF